MAGVPPTHRTPRWTTHNGQRSVASGIVSTNAGELYSSAVDPHNLRDLRELRWARPGVCDLRRADQAPPHQIPGRVSAYHSRRPGASADVYQRRCEVHLGVVIAPRVGSPRSGIGAYYFHYDIPSGDWFDNAPHRYRMGAFSIGLSLVRRSGDRWDLETWLWSGPGRIRPSPGTCADLGPTSDGSLRRPLTAL
jgi:hypothetical protein